jgi:hypothetical protein
VEHYLLSSISLHGVCRAALSFAYVSKFYVLKVRISLREEHRLRMFENRVLRGIFGPKRDGVTGEWRRLHNEELNDLYSSPNILRVIKSR